MATTRKRVHSAFTRALKKKGFEIDRDIAVSSNGSIKIEFLGGEWNLYIDGEFILTNPMESGSMALLNRTLKIHNKKSSTGNRFTVKKYNKKMGLAVTSDQASLNNLRKSTISKEYIESFKKQLSDVGFTEEEDSLIYDNYKLTIDVNGIWTLKYYDRLLGEGVCSLQSISTINNIIGDLI